MEIVMGLVAVTGIIVSIYAKFAYETKRSPYRVAGVRRSSNMLPGRASARNVLIDNAQPIVRVPRRLRGGRPMQARQ